MRTHVLSGEPGVCNIRSLRHCCLSCTEMAAMAGVRIDEQGAQWSFPHCRVVGKCE